MVEIEGIDELRRSGRIAAEALSYGVSLIKKGSTAYEVVEAVDRKIVELGAAPSFPSQISMDDVAAHFCPEPDNTVPLDNQLVKLDIGASVEGFLSDTAATIDLSGKHTDLVMASQAALSEAIKAARPGASLAEIGDAISQAISSQGYLPIMNLSGHGIGKFQVHTPPTVPNYNNGDTETLEEGQLIAIEPFATNGAGTIYESTGATVFMEVARKPVRLPDVRSILSEIQGYKGLPFARKWLVRKFPAFKVDFALRQLTGLGIIHAFPPLIEKKRGLVSQAEHTLMIREKPEILTLQT